MGFGLPNCWSQFTGRLRIISTLCLMLLLIIIESHAEVKVQYNYGRPAAAPAENFINKSQESAAAVLLTPAEETSEFLWLALGFIFGGIIIPFLHTNFSRGAADFADDDDNSNYLAGPAATTAGQGSGQQSQQGENFCSTCMENRGKSTSNFSKYVNNANNYSKLEYFQSTRNPLV